MTQNPMTIFTIMRYKGEIKMNRVIEALQISAATCGGVVGYIFGGWDKTFQVLLVFIVVDYISGIIAAAYNNKLNSKVGFKGIAKKVVIFMIVAIAVQLDKLIGIDNQVIRMATCFFYIANEGLSILENGGKLGVRYPSVLEKTLEQLREKNE